MANRLHRTCTFLVLLLLTGLPAFVQAQAVKTITVDPDLGVLTESFPFDENFFVKFTYDNPARIRYYELVEGRFKTTYTKVLDTLSGKDIDLENKVLRGRQSNFVINSFSTVPAKADNKTAVFVPMPRLRPDKDYKMAVFLAYSDLETRQFLDNNFAVIRLTKSLPVSHLSAAYINGLSNTYRLSAATTLSLAPRTIVSRTTPVQRVKNRFNFLPKASVTSAALKPISVSKSTTSSITSKSAVYAAIILAEYQKKADDLYAQASAKLQTYTAIAPNPLLTPIMQKSVQDAIHALLGQSKTGLIKTDSQSVNPLALQIPLSTLLTITTPSRLEEYRYGQRSVADVPEKRIVSAISPTPDTLFSRLAKTNANLTRSLDALTKISLYSRATLQSTDQIALVTFCDAFIADLSTRKESLTELIDLYNEFAASMQSDKRLVSKEENAKATINASSTVFDFDTRAKIQIIPDVGLAYYSAISFPREFTHFSYDHKNFNGFVPYLGVNISLHPINKNVPMRYLQHRPGSIFRRFAFFAGVTLNSIAKENERKDLLASKSLLAGISYRLSNAFRVTAGSFLFNAKDPNPLLSTYHLGAVPFVSVSIDLSLKSIATDLAGLILPK